MATTHIHNTHTHRIQLSLCRNVSLWTLKPSFMNKPHIHNIHICMWWFWGSYRQSCFIRQRKDSFYFLCKDLFSLLSLPTDLYTSCWRWSTEKMRRTKATLFFNLRCLSCCILDVHEVDKEKGTIRTKINITKTTRNEPELSKYVAKPNTVYILYLHMYMDRLQCAISLYIISINEAFSHSI